MVDVSLLDAVSNFLDNGVVALMSSTREVFEASDKNEWIRYQSVVGCKHERVHEVYYEHGQTKPMS